MGRHFDPAFWALAAFGVAAAIVYGLFFLNRPQSFLRAAVKTAMMASFTAAFAIQGTHPLLLLALVGSALGDFALAFDKKWVLPLGILSFLIAQLAYFVIFIALWIFSGDNSPLWPRYAMMALIILTTISFLIWMAPKLRWLALGVVPYSIAITAMACQAMWLPWVGWPAMIGAVLFLTSDLVLATELFRLAPDAPIRRITGPVVWWTCAGAQIFILTGVLLLVRHMV
jgi:uncharacterized membrane protein YhhN